LTDYSLSRERILVANKPTAEKARSASTRGGSRGGIGAIAPPKTYESNFIHNDFAQFRKKHSRYKAILASIVLSQKCCEVYFTSHTVVNP